MFPRSLVPPLLVVCLLAAWSLSAVGCGDDDDGAKQPDPPPPTGGTASQNPDVSNPANPAGPTGPMVGGPQPGGSDVPLGPDGGPVTDDEDAGLAPPVDAGTFVPPEPTCEDGHWNLAPGFLPAMRVDYIADRESSFTPGGPDGTPTGPEPRVLSSVGVPCANASDRARCEAQLKVPIQVNRHLLTTAGDSVRVWPFPSTLRLLGAIDTTAEALWVLAVQRGEQPCNIEIRRLDDESGYVFSKLQNFNCPPYDDGGYAHTALFRVERDGESNEIYPDGGFNCPTIAPPPEAPPPSP